ncbi:MAG: acyl-CoA thioesterase [Candidatus Aminicenantes bacterium]|nr:acyl-CoA thioesterase [Candidatus Aminicenantes bacterium]
MSTNPYLEVPEFPVEIEERVRYSEVDRFGVAHNKHYFEWFEIGRTEYCRQKGLPYKEIEEKGYVLVVVEAFCRYRRPLRYDERFIIQVACCEAKPRKIVFSYRLISLDRSTIIAQGYTIHVPVNFKAEVTSLPDDILTYLYR